MRDLMLSLPTKKIGEELQTSNYVQSSRYKGTKFKL